jgi:hypothetical protein
MASTEHKNRRRAIALERLNIAVMRLASSRGIDAIEIPKKMRDKDMREILIFEKIASFLETLGGEDVPLLEDHPLVIKQANREGMPIAKPKVEPLPKVKRVVTPRKRKASGTRKPKQVTPATTEAK